MLALLALVAGVHGIFFSLEPALEQCFSLHVVKGHNFSGAFLISGRGEEFVITRVFSPTNKVLYSNPPKAKSGEFKLTGEEAGLHKLCFRPIDSSPKVVSFELEHTWDELDEDYATEDTLRELAGTVRELSTNLNSISRNIHFFTRRERTHRDLTEQTCDRVAWSGLMKMLILGVITFTQIFMLKKLFDNKKSQV
mmetsp:Transcript_18398/g.33093  ORF Transcript_18398/g.33093 Transcript_18398/m.33093 type:complete len:195 (-) Transcript_18398:2887-3471(-)